jgi:serine/threonine protein kinase
MKHLTTIEHGKHRYILLPYAAYGDLEVFLHCGIAPDGDRKYDFNSFFPGVKDRDVTIPLLGECWSLANALEWLHNSIKIETSASTVFCAHMDLKPANVLIWPDRGSLVGKWMISDFGISVFKEETQQPDPKYGSIRDYVSQVTMNTRPKRQEGTYQAPEVKLAEAFSQSSHLTPEQRGIGRKSDIWAFGCILSEVLAFSLGRDHLVRIFQSARKHNAGDDYFYTEKARQSNHYLGAADRSRELPKEYEVRPAVLGWLDYICQSSASPQKWVDCWVGAVRKILVVDAIKRPDAVELLKLLRHVKEHVVNSPGSSVVTCPILNPKEDIAIASGERENKHVDYPPSPLGFPPTRSPPVTRKPVSRQKPITAVRDARNPTPIVFRSSTFEQEVIHKNGEDKNFVKRQKQDARISSAQGTNSLDIPMTPPHNDSNVRPDPHPIQEYGTDPDRESRTGPGATRSSLISSFAKPSDASGVMIDPAVHLTPEIPTSVESFQLPKKRHKITSMALTRSSNGARLACLAESSVYIYTLSAERLSVVLDREIPLRQIQLTANGGWRGIAVADNFVAAWGYSHVDHKKMVGCASPCLGVVSFFQLMSSC